MAEAPKPPRRILICVDESPASEQIVEVAARTLAAPNAVFELLGVVRLTDPPERLNSPAGLPGPLVVPPGRRLVEGNEEQARERLERLADENRLDAECTVVVSDDAASAIAEHAEATAADLIAVTTESRSALAELFVGSLSRSLVKARVAPILTMAVD